MSRPDIGPRLPLEIFWLILDSLSAQEDYHTLTACMLVCRLWGSHIRRMLPMMFMLSGKPQVARLGKHKGQRWKGPGQVFLSGGGGQASSGGKTISIAHIGTFSAMFARRWTRIKLMRIDNGEWRAGDMRPEVFLHLSAFTSVTSLGLGVVNFSSVVFLGRLVRALPNLKSLRCEAVSITSTEFDPRVFLKDAPHSGVTQLELQFNSLSFADATKSLATIIPHAVSYDLTVDCTNSFYVSNQAAVLAGVQGLIRASGSSLRKLTVQLTLKSDEGLIGRYLSVSDNTQLLILQLSLNIYSKDTEYHWLATCLSEVTSPAIAAVTLVFNLHLPQDAKEIHAAMSQLVDHCTYVNTVMELPIFSNIREFHITTQIANVATLSSTAYPDVIRAKFPNLARRGILRLHL